MKRSVFKRTLAIIISIMMIQFGAFGLVFAEEPCECDIPGCECLLGECDCVDIGEPPALPDPPAIKIVYGNVGFHCGIDSGGPKQDKKGLEGTTGWTNKFGNQIAWKANTNKHQPEYWLPLKEIENGRWELMSDAFECPRCGDTYWYTFSNMNWIYDGANIQLVHKPKDKPPLPDPDFIRIIKNFTSTTGSVEGYKFNFVITGDLEDDDTEYIITGASGNGSVDYYVEDYFTGTITVLEVLNYVDDTTLTGKALKGWEFDIEDKNNVLNQYSFSFVNGKLVGSSFEALFKNKYTSPSIEIIKAVEGMVEKKTFGFELTIDVDDFDPVIVNVKAGSAAAGSKTIDLISLIGNELPDSGSFTLTVKELAYFVGDDSGASVKDWTFDTAVYTFEFENWVLVAKTIDGEPMTGLPQNGSISNAAEFTNKYEEEDPEDPSFKLRKETNVSDANTFRLEITYKVWNDSDEPEKYTVYDTITTIAGANASGEKIIKLSDIVAKFTEIGLEIDNPYPVFYVKETANWMNGSALTGAHRWAFDPVEYEVYFNGDYTSIYIQNSQSEESYEKAVFKNTYTPPQGDGDRDGDGDGDGDRPTVPLRDPDVPLAQPEPMTILDEEVPLANIPQTGINSMALNLMLLGLALSAMAAVFVTRRKGEN